MKHKSDQRIAIGVDPALLVAPRSILISFALFVLGCSGPSSAGYDNIDITISSGDPAQQVAAECLTLPILPGSQIDTSIFAADRVQIQAQATRESVLLTATVGSQRDAKAFEVEQIKRESSLVFVPDLGDTKLQLVLANGCR